MRVHQHAHERVELRRGSSVGYGRYDMGALKTVSGYRSFPLVADFEVCRLTGVRMAVCNSSFLRSKFAEVQL
jgi:hypothetical protein